MPTTLTDRDYRHNLEITEIAFGWNEGCLPVIARSEATKQSIYPLCRAMDGFAEPVIGRAFARPVGSQ
jgi:hypothetical protein